MKTFRLLVVEDSDVDAGLVETALSEIRIPTIQATRAFSLQEARQRLTHKPFDAVLLDLDLPDSIGAATLRRILPVCGDAPVMIFSEDEPGRSARWIAEGAQDVLQKAELEPGLLLRALQHSIARYRIVKDLQRTAFVDGATGLLTRLGFFQLGSAATRHTTTAWSVARLKLSGLSRAADALDPFEADSVMIDWAEGIRQAVPESSLLARIGFDEGAVLSPTGALALHASLEVFAAKLNKKLSRRTELRSVRCVFGVAEITGGSSLDLAVEKAGAAMCENDIALAAGA